MLLWAQQRHGLTLEHRSQGCCKALHEVLLAMPCGVALKNHVLWKKRARISGFVFSTQEGKYLAKQGSKTRHVCGALSA